MPIGALPPSRVAHCVSLRHRYHTRLTIALLFYLSLAQDDLKTLAEKLNPVLKYFDPFDVTATSPWGFTNEQTIGWYRHSEIKHGRVAMMAFVGYVVQSNYHFPWKMTLAGEPYPSLDLLCYLLSF